MLELDKMIEIVEEIRKLLNDDEIFEKLHVIYNCNLVVGVKNSHCLEDEEYHGHILESFKKVNVPIILPYLIYEQDEQWDDNNPVYNATEHFEHSDKTHYKLSWNRKVAFSFKGCDCGCEYDDEYCVSIVKTDPPILSKNGLVYLQEQVDIKKEHLKDCDYKKIMETLCEMITKAETCYIAKGIYPKQVDEQISHAKVICPFIKKHDLQTMEKLIYYTHNPSHKHHLTYVYSVEKFSSNDPNVIV